MRLIFFFWFLEIIVSTIFISQYNKKNRHSGVVYGIFYIFHYNSSDI